MDELTELRKRVEDLERTIKRRNKTIETAWALLNERDKRIEELEVSVKGVQQGGRNIQNAMLERIAALEACLRESTGLMKMLDREGKYEAVDDYLDNVKALLSPSNLLTEPGKGSGK